MTHFHKLSINTSWSYYVPRETIIGGDEGITNLTSNRNGDVKFRNGSSHVNNGYEHTEM
jgi:hypothetical protein